MGHDVLRSHIMSTGHDLRCSYDLYTRNRRKGIIASLSGCGALGMTALYQTGVLKRLPGPRSGMFDAEKVNGSKQAYSVLQTPDALLGLASYSVTLVLTAMGPADRHVSAPLIPVAMGAKTLIDTVAAGKLFLDQWTKYRAFSVWSIVAAGASVITLSFVAREALAAVRSLSHSEVLQARQERS